MTSRPTGGIARGVSSATTDSDSRSDVEVREAGVSDKGLWENYIDSRHDSTFVDRWRWREALERSYGLPCYWYLASRHGSVTGALALTLTRHPLLGPYLATAPFANHGGFYFDDEQTASALLNKAEEVRRQTGADHVVLRHLRADLPPPVGWSNQAAYASFVLPIPGNTEEFLARLRKKTRWEVKQSLDNGFTIEFGAYEKLPAFWEVINKAMKDLGSPYHSRAYLGHILDTFGTRVFLAISRTKEGVPSGAALVFIHRDTAVLLHANVLREFRAQGAAKFLYFSLIGECCRRGISALDMGRSLVGSGNEEFKMKWRPERRQLAYWYNMKGADQPPPSLNQGNPRWQLAIRAWHRLPMWAHRLIGPRIITGVL